MNSRRTQSDGSDEPRGPESRHSEESGHVARLDKEGRRGDRRIFFTYLFRELQRRRPQALLIAVGLAVGVGLVVTVTAASSGVGNAQAAVLHSLYGVGTDVTVTKAPPPFSPSSISSPGSSKYAFSPGETPQYEDDLEETDGLGVLPASTVGAIARLSGVKAVAGGLSALDSRLTVPSLSQLNANGGSLAGATKGTSLTVDGVDLSHLGLGPFASTTLSAGRSFRLSDANVAIVDSIYANANKLTVGSTIAVAHVAFKIIGLVNQPQSAGAANVYIPLGRAQSLAATPEIPNSDNKVDTIYVVADSAADIPMVRREISKLLPGATVTTASSLARDVSGSLSSASSLISDLGRWLAGAVLVVVFLVAGLLSSAAVARRVRELGTLKALGWRTRRIVTQLMGEFVVIGVLGAVIGIAVGFAGAALVDGLAPPLAATVSSNPGSAPAEDVTFGSGGAHHSIAQGAQHTVPVHLSAPVTLDAIALAFGLALLGAVIAGSVGAWRAARLRPAVALSSVA